MLKERYAGAEPEFVGGGGIIVDFEQLVRIQERFLQDNEVSSLAGGYIPPIPSAGSAPVDTTDDFRSKPISDYSSLTNILYKLHSKFSWVSHSD